MYKRVILKIGEGTFQKGFPASLQIGIENLIPEIEVFGSLPPAVELQACYKRWQISYHRLGLPYRLEAKTGFITNVSKLGDCRDLASQLQKLMNFWLADASFREIREKLLEQLHPANTIRLVLQTHCKEVERLPWHLWDFFDRYPKAELALGASSYELIASIPKERDQFRILAVLGNSEGLDIERDETLLQSLHNVEVKFLKEPTLETLNEFLWDSEGWDILFFAGHSSSRSVSVRQSDEEVGTLFINSTDGLTIDQIHYALKKAAQNGLKIAIFNSCDGLALAHALADLNIPQILVMREPIPDQVAQTFLKYFLEAFSRPESFYLAVREAREKLHGLENKYPCASWLPVIYQNPAVTPPEWPLQAGSLPVEAPLLASNLKPSRRERIRIGLAVTGTVLIPFLGIRSLGWMQGIEFLAVDYLLRLQPAEQPDHRITLITIDTPDIEAQKGQVRQGSLSDHSLEKLLITLEKHSPKVIGLDIYRPYQVSSSFPRLKQFLEESNHFVAVCKASDSTLTPKEPGIAPPDELAEEYIGFSDFLEDFDGVLRRQLLAATPEPNSPCTPIHAFNTQIALSYLKIDNPWTEAGYFQLGDYEIKPLTPNFGGYRNLDSGGYQIMLNYRSLSRPDVIADSIPLTDLLAGKFRPEAIQDRIILIGTIDNSYGDYWLTPFSKSRASEFETAGVVLQAQMVSQLISLAENKRSLIRSWPEWGEILWIAGWGWCGGLLGNLLWLPSPRRSATLKLVLMLLVMQVSLGGICWLLLVQMGYWVPLVPASLALLATALFTRMGSSTPYLLSDYSREKL